ncbi:MAG: ATP-binding protein [Alphaproteobacteria bacterium]|nr:ATP-binding protein [Alphaproteobacteria bacterium]
MNLTFRFRTLEEVETLLPTIAAHFPNPKAVTYGLQELMVNAIEHGNLGITYDEKTKLVESGTWHDEIIRRLELPEYRHLYAELSIQADGKAMYVMIRDQGKGFDWGAYMQCDTIDPARPNGRGICTAMKLSFDELEYRGTGNEVLGTVRR